MNNSNTVPTMDDLRSRAEKLARNISKNEIEKMSSWDINQLIQELQIHQVELEMQNEHIIQTGAELQKAHDKYADLYDFAPVGYLTLDKQSGVMSELNLAMTQLLGMERNLLIGKRFAQFVVKENQDDFYAFLKSTFDSRHKNMCELYLQPKNGKAFFVRLEGVDMEAHATLGRCCQIAVIDIDERKKMEDELDRQVRQRTAELEHSNALLKAEIEERKKWQQDSQLLITELKNAVADAETRSPETASPEALHAVAAPTRTQAEVLKMTLKEFCDREIETVYGSRFWRYVVNSKKSYEPMFPMHELMEYTVQDFIDDTRCRLRIKKHYNNDTLEKASEAFLQYELAPFGEKK